MNTFSRRLKNYSCQTRQHETDRLTIDSRLTPKAKSATPNHRCHKSLLCISCYQRRHHQNLISICSASPERLTRAVNRDGYWILYNRLSIDSDIPLHQGLGSLFCSLPIYSSSCYSLSLRIRLFPPGT